MGTRRVIGRRARWGAVAVGLIAAGLLTACAPAAPATCGANSWCELPAIGSFGDPATNQLRVAGVSDAGNVLFSTAQSFGLTSDVDPVAATVDLFVWRKATGAFTRLSNALGTSQGTMTPDGRSVAYRQSSELFGPLATVRLRDLSTGNDSGLPWPTDPEAGTSWCTDQPTSDAPLIAPDGSTVFFMTSCFHDGWNMHVWRAASGTTSRIGPRIGVEDRNVLANHGESVVRSGISCPVAYERLDLATATATPEAPRESPAPPRSSVDGRWWLSSAESVCGVPPTEPFPSVTDVTTGTSTSLGLPAGFSSALPSSIVISGNGHRVALSDGVRVWQKSI